MFSVQKMFAKDAEVLNLLEVSAAEGLACARALNRLVQSLENQPTMEVFVKCRQTNKEITREISNRLVKALVTTIDREDVEGLASALYKVTKTIDKFAESYLKLSKTIDSSWFSRQTYLLEQATELVVEIVHALCTNANLEQVNDINLRLQQVEGDADKLLIEFFAEMYSGKHEPLKVLALKELCEILEKGIDRCRDAGNIINQIVLKHS